LGLNTSQIKRHFKYLKFTSHKNNDHEIHLFQPKTPKILENIMDFLPNVSFNSLVVPPTIQHVKLEKMSKQIKSDVNQMMPIKCDNIVKDNLIDLTNKNSSNPILIKEKITQFENIQNNNIIKDNFISPSSKNIPHHVFIKETNMGCDFFNKDVLKPFNGTSRNEEHLNHFVQLMKENPTLKKKKKKNLDQKNDDKNIIIY
jgi:hypothetical protein